MKSLNKFLFSFILLSSFAYSQTLSKEQSALLKTFEFICDQQSGLDNIKTKFPELSIEAGIAELEFNQNYGQVLSKINLEVRRMLGIEFESYQAKFLKEINHSYISKKISKKNALLFIETVKRRAKGEIESPYLESLQNYIYAHKPTIELSSVNYKTYHVKSYSKGHEINLSVEVPKKWKELDGLQPSVLKMFRGNGNEIISIQRSKNTKAISSFTKTMLLSSVPKHSTIITSYKKLLNDIYIDVIEYEEIHTAKNSNQKRRTTRYYMIRENGIFIIDCSLYGSKHENLNLISQQSKPIYESIVESIRFTSRDKNASVATIHKN